MKYLQFLKEASDLFTKNADEVEVKAAAEDAPAEAPATDDMKAIAQSIADLINKTDLILKDIETLKSTIEGVKTESASNKTSAEEFKAQIEKLSKEPEGKVAGQPKKSLPTEVANKTLEGLKARLNTIKI